MKRKVFAKGKKQNFKRFKRTPQYVKDNPENKIAREKEKDPYMFTDSEDDMGDDLGMGLELSDLPLLDEDIENKTKGLIALTQDSVRPFFADEASYDESKLDEGLAELRHTSFRPNQKEAIKRILFGRSTLFISPTGSGKSLCYQLPALLYARYRSYMTIVVSPLISLMEDQIHTLPKSLKAVSIHSNQNHVQKRRSIAQLVNGEAQIVFISPEAIVGGLLDLDDLKNLPPVGFVCIDEAHCLSEWSHNFRPAYLQFFRILHEKMNIKTFLGLTATATKSTAFAIARSLTINPDNDVIGSTTIPDNLILSVSHEKNKNQALIELLQSKTFRVMPSIIIYCSRRDQTEILATNIRTAMQNYSSTMSPPERKKAKSSSDVDSGRGSSDSDSGRVEHERITLGWHAEAYHAGLGSEVRKQIQRRFVKGEIRVVVATVAFGMGINKSNTSAVIHYDMPSSFESYVQEIGRAGRDGRVAQCHLFLSDDKHDLYYQQRNIYSSITEKNNLHKLVRYIFKPFCSHTKLEQPEDKERLDRLNEKDPHYISNDRKTDFIGTEVGQDSDEEEDYIFDAENRSSIAAKKSPTKFVRKSIVRKHRLCDGHEAAFPVEEAKSEINLWPESIITIMCQLEKAYPQLLMKQFPTMKSTCTLFCHKGPKQMEELAKKCSPVGRALFLDRRDHKMQFGTDYETPQKLTFDVIKVAALLGTSSADVIRMLKKAEWEIIEETGRFRRSQVRVKFEDTLSFHALAAGDLSEEEFKEVEKFVVDWNHQYEIRERERIAKVYQTFRKHCISVDQMKNMSTRLDVSNRLKTALNSYFDPSLQMVDLEGYTIRPLAEETNSLNEKTGPISDVRKAAIRASASAFLSAHGKEGYTPSIIAKIFQGISTPNFPAEVWGLNRKWWRKHVDVDFRVLYDIIHEQAI